MDRRRFVTIVGSGATALTCANAPLAAGTSAGPGSSRTASRSGPNSDQGKSARGRIALDNGWRFQPDPWGEGERRRYFETAFDDSPWRKIGAPQGFDRCVPGMESYEGRGWYRCAIRVAELWKDRRVVLRFEGVNYRCRVWLNGELLGEHGDGFLPFEFPVHSRLRFDQANVLAVLVDNTRLAGEVPGIQRGWRNTGGILREVTLLATDRRWIDDMCVVAEPDGQDGRLAIQVLLASEETESLSVTATAQIADPEGRLLATIAGQAVPLSADKPTTVKLTARVARITPWSPATPVLYKLRVSLTAGDQIIDTIENRIGFRRIECRGPQILLNGKPLYLTGFNRHEDSPTTGMSTDLETARRDILDMKRAGANFVRLCHYPHHPGELDLCDELGLLAMAEIPLWQWDDRKEDDRANAKKLAAAKRQLTKMILRDRNHPSVIFWSVGNENHEHRPRVRAGNKELLELARKLDSTRLVVHVSSFFWTEKAFDSDDVICINGYPNIPIWDVRPGAARDPDHPGAYFRQMMAELHARYPDKPIMVTEFGHPCFAGVQGCQFGEDTQARLISNAFSGMDAPYCCGAAIWCYADHLWPESGFYALMTSNFGVVTRDRRARRAYRAVQRMFSQRAESRKK